VKFKWVREAYTGCCTRNVRSGLAWFKAYTWRLRGMRKGDALCVEVKKMFYILYSNVLGQGSRVNNFF
jgi:hypothetical protein